MTAARVQMTSEVFWTCHLHALSTEVEEVMGLLLGDVLHQEDGSATVRIWAAVPQIRTDRRKDRVEASPEQMARCSAKAERFSSETGTLTRVVGWYHSHPHITVLPSHVDIRTQAMYQMLDHGFIGLIISTFNEDPTMHIQTVQITAFQSVSTAAQPPRVPALDATDIEQAMAASTAAAYSSGDWARREVQLDVVPSHGLAEQSLSDISKALLVTLFQEERAAYEAALEDAQDADGKIDPLAALQHAATYQQHLASLIEIILGPTLHSLRTSRMQAALQRQQLDALEPVLREAVEAQRDQQQQQQQAEAHQRQHHQQQTAMAPAVSQASAIRQPDAHVPQLASQLAAALSSGAQLGPPAVPTSSTYEPANSNSYAAASSDPWASTASEPWAMSGQEVTDVAKARLAAEDRSGARAAASEPVQISQPPAQAAAQQPASAVGSPDVFEDLFFSHLTLNDYGQVVPTAPPHGQQHPP